MVYGRACAYRVCHHKRDADCSAAPGGNRNGPGNIGRRRGSVGYRDLRGLGGYGDLWWSLVRFLWPPPGGPGRVGGPFDIGPGVRIRAESGNVVGVAVFDRFGRWGDPAQHRGGSIRRHFPRQTGPGGKRLAVNSRAGFGHQCPIGCGAGRRGWLAVRLHCLRLDAGCRTAGQLALASERPQGASSQLGILIQVSATGVHAVFPRGRGGQYDATHRFLGNDQLSRCLPDKYLRIEPEVCGPPADHSSHRADGRKLFCCVRGQPEVPGRRSLLPPRQ